jgi:hypothetical protein
MLDVEITYAADNVILIPQWREKNLGSILYRSRMEIDQRCFASLNTTKTFYEFGLRSFL